MNREFLLESVLGVALAVLLAVLIAWTARRSGAKPRGVVVGALIFVVIALPTLMAAGMTIWSLLLLLLLLLIPLVAALLVAGRAGEPEGLQLRLLQGLVAVGLLSVVLIAAGQALSLFSRLNYAAAVVLVVAAAALVVLGSGLAGTDVLGRWVAWLLLVPLVILIAIALFLGSWGDVADAAIAVEPAGPGTWLALAVAFAVLGAAHPTLWRYAADLTPMVVLRAAAGGLALVLLYGVALLLALGGGVVGPSLQIFTIPANLDAVPGPMLIFTLFLTLLYVAMASGVLLGASPGNPDATRVAVVAVLAVAVTLLGPGMERVAIITALVAAVLTALRVFGGSPLVGVVAAVVAVVVLELAGWMEFGWPAAVAIAAVTVISVVAARVSAGAPSAEVQPADLA